MRSFNLVRIAVLAASLAVNVSNIGIAFADSANQGQSSQRQTQQPSNTGPYDSPDFVVPPANVFS
jgi:hypothetical protein